MFLFGAQASAQKLDIVDLYNTGVDDTGALLAVGAADTHWQVQEDALGWVSTLYEFTNFCGSCGSIWVAHPISDLAIQESRPLAHPNHIRVAAPNRLFSWRQNFTLPADALLDTVTISYRVGYDDLSRNAANTGNMTGCNHTVWLNGTPYEMTSAGSNIRTECVGEIPAGSNFVAGQNTIEFRIQNLATYYGFRWEKVNAEYLIPLEVTLDGPAAGAVITTSVVTIQGTTADTASITATIRDSNGNIVQTITIPVANDGTYSSDVTLPDGTYTVEINASNNANQTATAGPRTFTVNTATMEPFVDIADLYNTGVDDTGALLDVGDADTHWQVQEAALGWLGTLYEFTNFCGSCGSIWVPHPISDLPTQVSRPLAHPSHIRVAAPNRLFSWRQNFTLPADAPLDAVTISYRVGYDDLSRNATDTGNMTGCNHTVWLNGTPYEMTSVGSNIRTECVGEIPAGANFQAGQNTIEFRIQNLATYYGFRWEKVKAGYPLPLQVALEGPADGTLTNTSVVVIQGTTIETASISATIRNSMGEVVQTIDIPVANDGTYSGQVTLADGTYTVEINATSGNQTATTGPSTFTVDTTAPEVTITLPQDGAMVPEGTVTIIGTTEPGASVTLVIKDDAEQVVATLTPTVENDGSYTAEFENATAGAYSIEVVATDEAGNESGTVRTEFTVEAMDEEPIDEEPVDEEPTDEEPTDEEPTDEDPTGNGPTAVAEGEGCGCAASGTGNASSVLLLLAGLFGLRIRRRFGK